MDWFQDFLVRCPDFTRFLVIAAGYWIGALKSAASAWVPSPGRCSQASWSAILSRCRASLTTVLGLAAFVAITGLQAGPTFVSALAEAGIGLLLGGMVVTLVPPLVGTAFALHVLRMNAVLGYAPAYRVGNILLTVWGTVVVGIAAGW